MISSNEMVRYDGIAHTNTCMDLCQKCLAIKTIDIYFDDEHIDVYTNTGLHYRCGYDSYTQETILKHCKSGETRKFGFIHYYTGRNYFVANGDEYDVVVSLIA